MESNLKMESKLNLTTRSPLDSMAQTPDLTITHPSSGPTLRMGIAIVEPGEYKTACGKGYFDCKKGEPEVLTLNNIGISYFLFESASSIWYWESAKNEFTQIWISN